MCFSPEKRSEVNAVAQAHSPVKIQNFVPQSNSENITMHKFTKITPLDKDKVDFSFSRELSESSPDVITNLSSIHKLAAEQLISVKGEVVQISATKVITMTDHNNNIKKIKKQTILIRDTTDSIKVILWGEYVDTVELNKTYDFKYLRVKVTRLDRYLNTPKTDPFKATESAPFDNPLVNVDNDLQLQEATSSTITANIIGIQKTFRTLACASCKKRVSLKPRSPLAVCQSCSLTQTSSSCQVQWSLRILVRNTEMPNKKITLNFPHNTTEDLVSKINPSFSLTEASEEDLIICVLEADKTIKLTYDNLSYQVEELDLI